MTILINGILSDFEIQMKKRLDIKLINKNKTIRHLPHFAIPVDHIVKMKENETIHKYSDLARELKKLWNRKVAMILIVVGAVGTIPKN